MKLKFKYLLLVFLTISVLKHKAQQNSLFNTYVYDPFQLNIAYAGSACTEANVHYRSQWVGMKETPKLLQVNAHTALGKSNALGLRVISQQMGLLNGTQAVLGYAYRFKLSETANMHLGLGVGWMQSTLNAQKAVVIDANDVTLANTGKQKANGFDSEFGAMYVGQKLKAGVAVFHLYNSNPSFAGSTYKVMPQSNISASYIFNKDKKVEIEPWLVDRYTLNGTNSIEGLLNFHFAKAITVGAGYRSNYGLLGFFGVKVGNLKIAYSFDYGISKNSTATGSSHQILLGFSTCKRTKAANKPEEEPPVAAATPTVAETPATEVKKEETVVMNESPKKEEVKEVKKEEEAVVTKEIPKKEEKAIVPEKMDVLPTINNYAEEVVFDLDKAVLNKEALAKLDGIAKLMKENPDMKLNIIGHTCDKGEAEHNKVLAEKRAAYAKDQLIKRGVTPKNINQIKGVGEADALFDNQDENMQRKNRTVRFELSK